MAERKLMFFLSFLILECDITKSNLFGYNPYTYSFSTASFKSTTQSSTPSPTPTLVKENKTWDEALEYCKTHHAYLACPTSDTQLLLDEKEAARSQTASVWMGLRFLDGQWIWVKGELMKSPVSLPSCPFQGYRCGARNTKSNLWENPDCLERLNFICY